MNPADRLRAAAELLRTDSTSALMDPAVGVALADWLDATAREFDALSDPDLTGHPLDGRRTAALAVADALGVEP